MENGSSQTSSIVQETGRGDPNLASVLESNRTSATRVVEWSVVVTKDTFMNLMLLTRRRGNVYHAVGRFLEDEIQSERGGHRYLVPECASLLPRQCILWARSKLDPSACC